MKRCIFFILVNCLFQFSFSTASAQRVGLVLSGGGARGLSHIGVIKALEEKHIPIDYIAGTSSGALVGALYAMGYSVSDMEAIVKSEDFYHWTQGILDEELHYFFRKPRENASWITIKFGVDSIFEPTIPNRLVNTSPMEFAMMERMAPAMALTKNNFDSLFIPFRCVASDIIGKKQVIFKDGDLARAVRASIAYPFVFTPVIYNGMILFDGGIYNNFPADVVLEDFYPDIIIGVKVSGITPAPANDNIISQLKTMLVQNTNYSVICENGIIIEPQVDQFGLLDFRNHEEIIKSGYLATQKRIQEIEESISRRISSEDLKSKRSSFRTKLPQVLVDSIIVKGITPEQADYVRRVIKPSNEPVTLRSLEAPYFKLVADNNIKTIFPVLVYNQESGFFNMELEIEREKDIITEFGGNFSSRPINEAFLGIQYNLWGRQSLTLRANTYFGKLYSSLQFAPRLDVPFTIPFYVEPRFTMNRWDFFKSSSAFFEDIKPSYLIQTEKIINLDLGIPSRNKGKLVIGNSVLNLDDRYYQTREFSQSDTADATKFNAYSSSLTFERSTLNRKMYSSQGTYFLISGRYVDGRENYVPGSTSPLLDAGNKQLSWYQLRVIYDNYFQRVGPFKLGFFMESVFSNQPFFSNYTSSLLRAQAFQPLQETRTLFLENFRAHNYIGSGLRAVISVKSNIDLRFEAYGFQPFQEFIQNEDKSTKYGDAFKVRYYIGSAQAVYHSPIGPLSLSLNYYEEKEEPFSVLFHFGYILFNERAFD